MKKSHSLLNSGLLTAIVLIGLGLCHCLAATATFTVSPSAVSNTYTGPITLQIGGLTNGETVVVQQFLDANTNGTIGAGDWLVQQFRLTDGVISTIGGVTNINVPGDSTATNGSITAQMNFLTSGAAVAIAGRYLYKLSSPSGRFTPVTNLFTITNVAYAQSISGNVVCSGTNVPNAMVLAFAGLPMDSSPVGGTIGNNAGGYSLPLPPGTYSLMAFKTNYVVNAALAPTLTLASGAKPNTNLALLGTTRTISGKMADAANSNLGLPGVLIFPANANGLMGFGFTDTNGNFSARVTASQWEIQYDSDQLPALGYAQFQDHPAASTTSGNVANLNLPIPKGTALFYGTVRDPQSRPLVGVPLFLEESNGQYEGDGVTDQSGNYVVAVVAGHWDNGPDNGGNLAYANYVFSELSGALIADGQAVRADFLGIIATNRISGYLKDDSNHPISNVWIWAAATINDADFHAGAETDASGYYQFNVCNGQWWVGVNCAGGSSSLGSQYLCPNSQSVTITNNNATVNFTAQLAPSQITGYVRDGLNNPAANVGVYAYMPINGASTGATTDSSGYYSLSVANGEWNVGLSCCGDHGLSPLGFLCVGEQSITVDNSNGAVDFSVTRPPYQITGHLRDTSNNPIPNVDVYAYGTTNNSACTTTAADGAYTLNVSSDDWYVEMNCGELNSLGCLCISGKSVTVSTASVVLDFIALRAPYTISGWVRDSGDQPIRNLYVYAYTTIGGGNFQSYFWTDYNGNYSLPVADGQWYVGIDCGGLSGDYQCPSEVTVNIAGANVVTNFTLLPQVKDVLNYYVMKVVSYRQLDATTLVPDTDNGPFVGRMAIIQSALGNVPMATVTLPGGGVRNFPAGSTELELTLYERFSSQAAFDAVYTDGNYAFSMGTLHDGFQYPVVTMPVAAYPAAPRVSNFTAAQAINPANPFTLQWSNPPDAKTNDIIWVFIVDAGGNMVFSTPYPPANPLTRLNGTNTSVEVPANTLQPGGAYTGFIHFDRGLSRNMTGYPGAAGYGLVGVSTAFSLAAPTSLPVLSQPSKMSNTQFSFAFSGIPGQYYTVLTTTNPALPLVNWSTLLITNLSGNSALIQDNLATSQRRFYRVKVGL